MLVMPSGLHRYYGANHLHFIVRREELMVRIGVLAHPGKVREGWGTLFRDCADGRRAARHPLS